MEGVNRGMGTISVSNDFSELCSRLRMSDTIVASIQSRYHAITRRINEEYWNSSSDTLHSMYSGSYGRGTAIFASDVDVIVELPWSLYSRYNNYVGNGQSALSWNSFFYEPSLITVGKRFKLNKVLITLFSQLSPLLGRFLVCCGWDNLCTIYNDPAVILNLSLG